MMKMNRVLLVLMSLLLATAMLTGCKTKKNQEQGTVVESTETGTKDTNPQAQENGTEAQDEEEASLIENSDGDVVIEVPEGQEQGGE